MTSKFLKYLVQIRLPSYFCKLDTLKERLGSLSCHFFRDRFYINPFKSESGQKQIIGKGLLQAFFWNYLTTTRFLPEFLASLRSSSASLRRDSAFEF